jgi:predicted membrane-bound mannosyltransferase
MPVADAMRGLFASGVAVDVILGLVVLEAVTLTALHRITRRGIAPADILPNLLAGAGLLLALRAALVAADWPWIALCLAGALAAHLVDLSRRRI